MRSPSGSQNVSEILKSRGAVKAGELLRELGVSRATLARRLVEAGPGIVALGKTRNLRYALLRTLTDLDGELPLFRVDEEGLLKPLGKLLVLHAGQFAVEPGAQVFDALPPEIFDMVPQGFMGRAFAALNSAILNLPPRLQDWSDDHVLKVVARRGEDLPGNLIVGRESAERWRDLSPHNGQRAAFEKNATLAMNDQPGGSSAGGERPKFSALIESHHKLVKFVGPLHDPVQRRWRDLLWCEALAAKVLSQGGVPAVSTRFSERGDHAFLEIERFDRVGMNGRLPYLSFAAVDGFLFGELDTWSACAGRLNRAGLMAEADAAKVRFTDAFARLIADTDRHCHNMGLMPEFASASSLIPRLYRLAPVFDKLPMLFSPVEGRLIEREYTVPIPGAEVIEVWNDAMALAKIFWDKAALEKSLAAGFRKIARRCLAELH